MEGREAMAMSGGSAKYFANRGGFGVGGTGSASQAGAVQLSSGFRPLSSPSSVGSTFSVEPSQENYPQRVATAVPSGTPSTQPVKKKRGRPRKYAPDGTVSLGLSPLSATPKASSSSLSTPTPKKSRGRPPGSGRKQILASIGGWMNLSAGMAFAPHVIRITDGEDIAAKILSFSQQRPRAVCILSATGAVSSVTLRQPASSDITRYEGRCEILCLSGSYLVAEDGSPQHRTGGISVSLSTAEGNVIGGAVAGLIAAGPVQVVACSFIYSGPSIKQPIIPKASAEDSERPGEKLARSPSAPSQHYTSSTAIRHSPQAVDQRSALMGIDLTRRCD